MHSCLCCSIELGIHNYKYCSLKCQQLYQYSQYLTLWKSGLVSGTRGVTSKFLSKHMERYLREKFNERCVICGWNVIHPITKRPPLEIDHIDGNPNNNREENLRLICPNCHSLTRNYRNLNKGNGRSWRLKKKCTDK